MDLRSPRDGLLHATSNKRHGITRDDWTDDGIRVQWITRRKAVRPRHELAEEFIVDLALNDDAPRIQTNLALMKEGAECRGADRVIHVHVVEDNHRVETAKFQHGALQGTPGAFRQHPCGLDPADQIDDANFGTIEKLVRNGARGSWRVSDDIDDPCGEPGFLRDLGKHDARRDRRELRRLDHHGISGSDGRDDRPPGQDIGAVPWSEAGDDAQRTTHADRVRAGQTGLQNLAFGQEHPACDLLECRGDQVLLECRE